MADDMSVRVDGLREFRRDIKRLDPAVDKALRTDIRDSADKVLAEARADAPRLTGELAASLRVSVTTRGAAIYSRLPQAPLLHWGGTIEPRGVPITFPRTEFISKPAERAADRLAADLSDAVERAAQRTGWR